MLQKKNKKNQPQKHPKKNQPRQNGSDGIRTRCKSAGDAKQRLYDQDDDTMIEQLYKFVVYKVYLM